jgi:hypothetical protein
MNSSANTGAFLMLTRPLVVAFSHFIKHPLADPQGVSTSSIETIDGGRQRKASTRALIALIEYV